MKSNVFVSVGALLLCLCALVNAQVIINEVNTGTPDFVEYLNLSVAPVDMSGWMSETWYATAAGPTISDGIFTFPAATMIAPGGYLVTADGVLGTAFVVPFNYFWVDDRTTEVALRDPLAAMPGVDYMIYDFFGNAPTGNIPAGTSWTGTFTGAGGMLLDAKYRNCEVDTDQAVDWLVTTGAGTAFATNPCTIFFDASIACNGGGGVDFSVINGTPGNSYYIATAAVFTGIAPAGPLLGIDLTFAELVAQIQTGLPFVGVIGASGGNTFNFPTPPGCGSFGIPLDYVGIEFAAGSTIFTNASPAYTVIL